MRGRMRGVLAGVTLAGGLASVSPVTAQAPTEALPSFAEPGISPDGTEIAFVSGGDIWTVPSEGGAARLLVAHSSSERRPLYSPDGTKVAFMSRRDGSLGVFVLDLVSGEVSQVTYQSGSEYLDGWSRDSEWIYFSSSAEDISSMQDVFRVRATGGTPMAVAADRYETEFFSAPAPDGSTLAISTRGRMAHSQWWRNGHSHIDEAEIWLVDQGANPTYRPLSTGGKNLWPMWDATGDRVFFMSDRSGAENLWVSARSGGGEERLTSFETGRVLWPTIAVDRPLIAFERDFGIWTFDAETGATRELDIRLMGSVEGPQPEVRTFTDDFDELAVSPDGEKVAFVARGEIFASTAEGGPGVRVTHTPAEEGELDWSADSERLVYTSWRSGTPLVFTYDFTTEEERQLTEGDHRDATPTYSPDGRYVAYTRDGRELRVIDSESGEDRLVAEGVSGRDDFTWSPDSRWLAFGGYTDEFNNALLVPVEGGEARQVSFLSNTNFGSVGWSSSGEFLLFRSGQRTEPGRLVRVDLVPRTPTFQEDRFWELFNEEPPDRPEPEDEPAETPEEAEAPRTTTETPNVEVVFDDIRRRGYLVDLDFSVGGVVMSPAGDEAIVTGSEGPYRVRWEEDGDLDVDALDVGPGGMQSLQYSRDGRTLYYLRRGSIEALQLGSGDTRPISVTAELEVDFDREKVAVFEQAWGEMRDGFYDRDFHGADWDRVRRTFAPRAAGARTRPELARLMNLMLGELNASHLGFNSGGGGGGPSAPQTGRLGLRFDRLEYEETGRFRVTELVELGPADVSDGIQLGDYLLAIDDVDLDRETNLDRVLAATPGEKVVARVSESGSQDDAREVELQPISLGAERQLVYRSWVEGRRAYVDELSEGRLGYVHIASMSSGALDQLTFDLDQENHAKEGVVVDVRNNNGGFVNVYAIDVFSRRNYFTMKNRDGVVAPSRVQLGQRALLAPTVLVTNQHTLSDGEDFTEGYRTLELGTVVGEPTAGWIIYTGSAGLVDGSSVRMPRTEIRGAAGDLMELAPRPVDIEVERPAGESYSGRDRQLERAVNELLTRIDRSRPVGSGG